MRPPGGRGGFSLLELLVAVSIVLLLAALLLPVLGRAREAARRAACLSQLRQLGAAFLAYAEDGGGVLPHEDNGDGMPPDGCGWYEVLSPWLGPKGGADCRQCPGVRVDPSWRSYKMNSLLEDALVPFRSLSDIPEPSRTVLAFDGRIENPGVRMLPKGTWDLCAPRHGGGTAMVFCDGHAAWTPARFDAAGWTGPGEAVWTP